MAAVGHLRHGPARREGRVAAPDADGARTRGRREPSRPSAPASTRCSPGDEVVLSWAPSCGECADCRRGRPAACIELQRAIASGTLPATARPGCRIGGETGLPRDGDRRAVQSSCRRRAASRCRSAATSAAAARGAARLRRAHGRRRACSSRLAPEPGSTVLVVGAGGVGQFCVQGARIAGAGEIVCVDPLEARLERAAQIGRRAYGDARGPAGDAYAGWRRTVSTWHSTPWARPQTTRARTSLDAKRRANRPRRTARRRRAARPRPAPSSYGEKELTGSMYSSEDPAPRRFPSCSEHLFGSGALAARSRWSGADIRPRRASTRPIEAEPRRLAAGASWCCRDARPRREIRAVGQPGASSATTRTPCAPRAAPVFVSGVVPGGRRRDARGGDDVVAQARQVFANMGAVPAAGGATFADVREGDRVPHRASTTVPRINARAPGALSARPDPRSTLVQIAGARGSGRQDRGRGGGRRPLTSGGAPLDGVRVVDSPASSPAPTRRWCSPISGPTSSRSSVPAAGTRRAPGAHRYAGGEAAYFLGRQPRQAQRRRRL